MGKKGPCFHCGVKQTILWRNGPPEKPVLCNACGSRWRVRRTLDGYIPRHGNIEIESYQQPCDMKPARDEKKLEVGIEVSGQDGSSACLEEEMNNISSLGSAGSSSDNCMQMEETNAYKDPLWNPDSVPRRKRSERRKRILSPVERLQRQLHNILQEPDFENISADDENILIYARNKYIPPNEIGLGAKLLVSPPTATEHLTSLSPMAEDNDASCSVNVPVGNSNSNLRSRQISSLESWEKQTNILSGILGEADKYPLWNPESVPRRKRSERRKHILSPVERLQRQLHTNLQEPDLKSSLPMMKIF